MSAALSTALPGLPGFTFDHAGEVYVPTARALVTRYRDGSEEYVASVIREASDLACGSEELCAGIRDFASRYHLSPERVNLLRPLQPLLHGRILEVGAGCGAITRFLGETGADVLALESSYERSVICHSRCRDLNNVEVAAGELADLKGVGTFDVLVIVGVLEYSQMFMGGREGPAAFLRSCRKLLRPGGCLLLAIENQLGLKYFAGAPEDHLDQPYAGVEGRYGDKSPVTFGRHELRQLIEAAGWSQQDFLYPFPDYKFPSVVLGAGALAREPELASSILRFTAGADFGKPYYPSLSEEMAWPVAVRNGVVHDLANSFLVLASDHRPELARSAVHVFSTRRRRAFAKAALLDPGRSDAVQRAALYPQHHAAAQADAEVRQSIADEPLLRGKLLAEDFCEVLNQPGWTALDMARCAQPWVEYLRSRNSQDGEADPLLPGELLDCIPMNLLRDSAGVLHRFDQEWISNSPLRLSRVLVRGLLDVFLRLRSIAPRGDKASDRVFDLVVECVGMIGIPDAAETVETAVAAEVRFQALVSTDPGTLDLYRESRFRVVRVAELIRNINDSISPSEANSGGALARALVQERRRADLLDQQLSLVRGSRAYRISSRLARYWRMFVPRTV